MDIAKLKPAEYNPRKMSEEKLQLLKESIEEFGDLSGIVFNCLTGNLVGGHQRLKCIPPNSLIRKKKLKEKTKTGTIAEGYILVDGETWKYREVEWDLRKEKKANIAANKHGGEWDEEKLKQIMQELANHSMDDLSVTGYSLQEIKSMGIFEGHELQLDEKLEEKHKNLKEFKKTHILISFDPNIFGSIKNFVEEISKTEGVEIEQSSN